MELTLEEAKNYLHVDSSDEDSQTNEPIKTVREECGRTHQKNGVKGKS